MTTSLWSGAAQVATVTGEAAADTTTKITPNSTPSGPSETDEEEDEEDCCEGDEEEGELFECIYGSESNDNYVIGE